MGQNGHEQGRGNELLGRGGKAHQGAGLVKATYHYVRATFFHGQHDFLHEMSSGLTTALEFLMSAEIAKTFLLQNLESVVPLAATFALRAMMSLMLHWEMEGGHRSGRKKEETPAGEAEKRE